MKYKIPYYIFIDYIKHSIRTLPIYNNEKMKNYHNQRDKFIQIMKKTTWQDYETLAKEELEKVPISWLYEWIHVTANNNLEDKIVDLYHKHNIKILNDEEYLLKYNRELENIDYNDILPPAEIKYYIENHLINDDEFIKDIDKYLHMSKIKDLPLNERLEKLKCQYHNMARQFMLKLIVFKHLNRLVLNCTEDYTDIFWQDIVKKFLADK